MPHDADAAMPLLPLPPFRAAMPAFFAIICRFSPAIDAITLLFRFSFRAYFSDAVLVLMFSDTDTLMFSFRRHAAIRCAFIAIDAPPPLRQMLCRLR